MKEEKKRKLPIFRFNPLAVFVDPLLRARLRARLLHARENAHTSAVFSLFPPLSPSPCPSSVSSLLLSSLLSLSGPRGCQEAVTAWQRALLHINFFPSSAILAHACFCIPRARAPLFFAGTVGGFAFIDARIVLVSFFFLLLLELP